MNSFNVTSWNARKKCIHLSKCITLHLLVFELLMLVTAVLSHRTRTWFCDHNRPQMAYAKDNGSNSLRALLLLGQKDFHLHWIHLIPIPPRTPSCLRRPSWKLSRSYLLCSALTPGCMYSIVGENSYTWGGRDDQGAYYHFCINHSL